MKAAVIFPIVFAVGMVSFASVSRAGESLLLTQGEIGFLELSEACSHAPIRIPKLGTFAPIRFSGTYLLPIPVGMKVPVGTYALEACGASVSSVIEVRPREKETATFVIPEEKGGMTVRNALSVARSIARDSSIFAAAWSNKRQLWSAPFTWPVDDPVITDTFGYVRDSSGVQIMHAGMDFRAATGTPVLAMNRGVVRYAGNLPSYGKTMILDHGKGIQTAYLHLSKILAPAGKLVAQGERIALSGNTGFVTGPHLHVSVRVAGISVDPAAFMSAIGITPLSN